MSQIINDPCYCMTEEMLHDRSTHAARPAAPDRLARAVLMFYDPGPWTEERRRIWRDLTGSDEATTRVLADFARRVTA